MKKASLLLFATGCLAIFLGLIDEAAAAKRPYRYVSLDEAIPAGFDFFQPVAISEDRRVYGTLFACGDDGCSPSVAVFRRRRMVPLHEGLAGGGNHRGEIGGGVVLDPDLGTTQAALFTERAVELIPPVQNDEFASAVRLLSETRIAFVEWFDAEFNLSRYLTRRGAVTPLDFGPDPAGQFDINDRGRISGTSHRQEGDRAFRYVPASGSLTLLEPLPTEPASWGQAINRRGHVLGYSFVPGGLERIGVWRGASFRTHFVEGTPEVPTISNRLLWNERGEIVITDANDLNSYLVPRRGVRLNLADLTRGPLPVFTRIVDINDEGDMVGVGGDVRGDESRVFLLRRVGSVDGEPAATAASSPRSAAAPALARSHQAPPPVGTIYERLFGGLGKDRTAKSRRG